MTSLPMGNVTVDMLVQLQDEIANGMVIVNSVEKVVVSNRIRKIAKSFLSIRDKSMKEKRIAERINRIELARGLVSKYGEEFFQAMNMSPMGCLGQPQYNHGKVADGLHRLALRMAKQEVKRGSRRQ